MTVPAHIQALCEEKGIRLVPRNVQPDVGEARAGGAMDAIWKSRGEAHLRLVLTILSETDNNRAYISRDTLWAVSHILRAYPKLVEDRISDLLEVFDAMPLGQMAFHNSRSLRGIVKLPHSLAGMINERIVRGLGEQALQPDLFDDLKEIDDARG